MRAMGCSIRIGLSSLAVGLLLAACQTTAPSSALKGESPSARSALDAEALMMVGGWTPAGTSCQTDVGHLFASNGRWATLDLLGTWSLVARRLAVVVTEELALGAEKPRPLRPPQRYSATILSLSPQAYAARGEDGKVQRWVKCPQANLRSLEASPR